jgi:Flp pilus assembly pilin Flp
MSAAIRRWWFQLMGEHGAGMVEYALLVAFIGIALIAAVTALGTGLFNSFSGTATTVDNIIT